MDTAAVMASLDLVISSDTSVLHLAGALGRPTWAVLKSVPDWRWLLGRPDTPWYPTMRLFRQERPGDWAGVFARIAAALAPLVAAMAGAPVSSVAHPHTLPVDLTPGALADRIAALKTASDPDAKVECERLVAALARHRPVTAEETALQQALDACHARLADVESEARGLADDAIPRLAVLARQMVRLGDERRRLVGRIDALPAS